MSEDSSPSFPWYELVELFYRARWFTVGGAALGLLAAVALVVLTPPVYMAQAKIMLTAQAVSGPRQGAMSDKQIQAELALMKSPALIQTVLDTAVEDGTLEDPPPEPEDIGERIEAASMGRSNVIQLLFSDARPEWASRLVNDLLDAHVERIASLTEQVNARTFFEQQRELANQRWQEARQALASFRENRGTILLGANTEDLQEYLASLENQRVTTETQVLQLEAKVEFLSAELRTVSPTVDSETRTTESEWTKQVRSRIFELELLRSEKLSRYTPQSTVIRDLDRQIAEANELLRSGESSTLSETLTEVNPSYQALEVELVTARSQYEEMSAKMRALTRQIDQYRDRLGELEQAAAELDRLRNELASAKEMDETYRRMEEEARLAAALDESKIVNVIVVEKAEVPTRAEPSKPLPKLVIGFGLGLVLGTAWGLLRDWLNPAIKSSSQAQRLAGGVPVLAEIPSQ